MVKQRGRNCGGSDARRRHVPRAFCTRVLSVKRLDNTSSAQESSTRRRIPRKGGGGDRWNISIGQTKARENENSHTNSSSLENLETAIANLLHLAWTYARRGPTFPDKGHQDSKGNIARIALFKPSDDTSGHTWTPEIALTTVDLPCATCPMVPMLIVAWRLMTSGVNGVNVDGSSVSKSCACTQPDVTINISMKQSTIDKRLRERLEKRE